MYIIFASSLDVTMRLRQCRLVSLWVHIYYSPGHCEVMLAPRRSCSEADRKLGLEDIDPSMSFSPRTTTRVLSKVQHLRPSINNSPLRVPACAPNLLLHSSPLTPTADQLISITANPRRHFRNRSKANSNHQASSDVSELALVTPISEGASPS